MNKELKAVNKNPDLSIIVSMYNEEDSLDVFFQEIKKVLNEISSSFGNILTLNQEMPINGIAYITLSIDISNLSKSVKELMKILSSIEGVKLVELLALE